MPDLSKVWIRVGVAVTGPCVDTGAGRCPVWFVLNDGRRFWFSRHVGPTVRLSALRPDECLIVPGLVYRQDDGRQDDGRQDDGTGAAEAAHG